MPCHGGYLCSTHACPTLSTWDCTGAVPHLYILQVPAFSLHSKSRVTNPTVECDPPLSICWRFPDLHNAKGEKLRLRIQSFHLIVEYRRIMTSLFIKTTKGLRGHFLHLPSHSTNGRSQATERWQQAKGQMCRLGVSQGLGPRLPDCLHRVLSTMAPYSLEHYLYASQVFYLTGRKIDWNLVQCF